MSRDALVVGLNHYQCLPGLQAPAQDAEAIAQRLSQDGEFRVQRGPEIILDGQPMVGQDGLTLRALETALVKLFKPSGANVPETALFYFSGHGIQKEAGISEGFLATSDADPERGQYGLSLFWLRRLLQQSPVRKRVIWLDCCHSGAFLDFLEADPGSKPGTSRFFMAASREYEQAYESLEGRYSVFTEALLEGLDPERVDEGAITNYALTDWVSTQLKSELQQPLFENSGSEIVLTRLPSGSSIINTKSVPTAAPSEVMAQLSESESAQALPQRVAPASAQTGAAERSAPQAASEQNQLSVERQDICPYPGLRAFETDESRYFTGRDDLVQQLLSSLYNHNLVSVVGAASSGKTSLLQAGLIPALERRARGGGDRWKTKIFRPLDNPILDLAAVFIDADASDWERSEQLRRNGQLIASDERGLLRLVQAQSHHLPGADHDPREPRLLLIVDQFERLLRHKLETDEQASEGNPEAARVCQHVINSLMRLLEEESALVHIVLAVRSDFWEDCYLATQPLQQSPAQLIPVEPLPQEALKAVILKPALRLDWQCEIHLADMLLEDVAASPARLALLQLALRSIWLRQVAVAGEGEGVDRVMRLGTYAEMGRIRGLLVSQATGLLKELSETDQSFVQRIFLALTQLGEGSPDSLRRVSKSELGSSQSPQREALAGVLETLIESRLVVSSGNRVTLPPEEEAAFSFLTMGKSNDWVEASHETLVRDWPDLRSWITTQRDRLTQQRRIERQTEDWCDGDALFGQEAWLQGERLSEAEAYLRDHPDDLSSLAQHFIRLSQDAEIREQHSKRKGRLVQIGIATALTAALFALMYQMFQQRHPQARLAAAGGSHEHGIARKGFAETFKLNPQALYDRLNDQLSGTHRARSPRQNPSQPRSLDPSQRNLGDPMTSLLLGQLDLTPHPAEMPNQANQRDGQDQRHRHQRGQQRGASPSESHGFEADLMSNRRATPALPQLQSLAQVEGIDVLRGITLSRDGKHLAGLDGQGQVNLWNLEPEPQGDLNIRNVSTASDASATVKPQLHRLAWPSPPEVDQTQASELLAMLAEEGVMSVSAQGLDMAKTHRRLSFGEPAPGVDRRSASDRLQAPKVEQISLSADGRAIASRAEGQTAVTIWATGSGKMAHHLTSIPDPIDHVLYSPGDAQRLATAAGSTLYLWQMGELPRVAHRLEHPQDVRIDRIDYSRDGRLILTSGSDRQLRLWDAYSGELRHEFTTSAPVAALLMGPTRFAVLGSNNTIQVWDQSSGESISQLKLPSVVAAQPELRASELAFSPKEDQLVVVQGKQGWNWNLASGKLQTRFKVFAKTVTPPEGSFEPQDSVEAQLLKQDRPRPRRQKASAVLSPSMEVFAKPTLRFSADGSLLLATRQREIDGETVLDSQLLNLNTRAVSNVLSDRDSAVIDAQFSADGKVLVTADQHGVLTFWDTQMASKPQKVSQQKAGQQGPSQTPSGSSPTGRAQGRAELIAPASLRSQATLAVAHRPSEAVRKTLHPETQLASLRRPQADLTRRPRQSLHLQPSEQGSLTFLVLDEAGQLQRWDSDSGQVEDLAPLIGPITERVIGAPADGSAANAAPTRDRIMGAITASDSSEDQLTVATASADGQVVLWSLDPETGSPRGRRLASISGHRSPKAAAKKAASGRSTSAKSSHSSSRQTPQQIHHLRLSPDGETLLALDSDQRLHLWDTGTGDRMVWPQHLMDIRLVQISDSGQHVLTADGQGTITLWERDSGKPIQALGLPGLTAANLTADGGTLAIALPGGTIKLIDSSTGAIQTTLRGHRSDVRDVAFNPEGDRLLSGGSHGSVRLWDLGDGEGTRTLQAAVEPSVDSALDSTQGGKAKERSGKGPNPKPSVYAVHQVTFGDNGNYIAAADAQGIVRFWANDRESYARIARDRSAHQLYLDRCLSAVSTTGCPVPTVSSVEPEAQSTANAAAESFIGEASPVNSSPVQSSSAEALDVERSPANEMNEAFVEQVQASTAPLAAAVMTGTVPDSVVDGTNNVDAVVEQATAQQTATGKIVSTLDSVVDGTNNVDATVEHATAQQTATEQIVSAVAAAEFAALDVLDRLVEDLAERIAEPVADLQERLPRNANPFLTQRKSSQGKTNQGQTRSAAVAASSAARFTSESGAAAPVITEARAAATETAEAIEAAPQVKPMLIPDPWGTLNAFSEALGDRAEAQR